MKALKGGIGFFTQIPVSGDLDSFESLRRNLWILPIIGLISGVLMAIPSYFMSVLGIGFVSVIFYILVEGINHIDGLADFGDAIFANKKFEALKDTKLGSGGAIFIVFYIVALSFSFQNLKSNIVYAMVLSQVCAKVAMLILLTTTKPLWDGLAKTMMEFASKRDLVVGILLAVLIFNLPILVNPKFLLVFLSSILLAVLYRQYVIKKFGGVNGDMIGALNCIVFAFSNLMFLILV